MAGVSCDEWRLLADSSTRMKIRMRMRMRMDIRMDVRMNIRMNNTHKAMLAAAEVEHPPTLTT